MNFTFLSRPLRINVSTPTPSRVRSYYPRIGSQLRFYSTPPKPEVKDPQTSKPKPKTATQLRRTASASYPIRSNPTPTRGVIKPVSVLTTAERYILPQFRVNTSKSARFLHDAWWIPKWGPKGSEGEVFIFENGSFVCWGLDENSANEFYQSVIRKSAGEIGRLVEPETEDVEFVLDSGENTRLQGDLILLGKTPSLSEETTLPNSLPDMAFPVETLMARYSFSQALARSSALSALETSLENYLSSVYMLPHSLSRTGKPSLGRRALIMKLGELMRFRQGLNLNRENFSDTPDFYWAEPVLEGYFNSMTEALDMKARTKSVNDKITYAAEVQTVLRELLTESSAHRMELIIIALIAVEVVICLIRDGPELWHMLYPRAEDTGTKKSNLALTTST